MRFVYGTAKVLLALLILLAVLILMILTSGKPVDYDRKPPEAAFEVGLRAEDLMFEVKEFLKLDHSSTQEHSSVDNYCHLPFPKTSNPIEKAGQVLRGVSKNPIRGFRPDAGLNVDMQALDQQRDLKTLFDEMRRWLDLKDFAIHRDTADERRGGHEIQAINHTEQMSFEMWGRGELVKIRFQAPCIEANRRY